MRTKIVNRRGIAIVAIAAASTILSGCGAGGASSTGDEKVTLTFQSLAYQKPSVAATKDIVDSWNKANPKIQITLQQGTWDNVHDQLVTQFQGGTAPDIIHDESSDIMGFAEQGYLADISKYLDPEIKKDISNDLWSTVTTKDGKIVAAPSLVQTYVVYANTDLFKKAGVEIPTGKSLSWDDFATLAKKLKSDSNFGVG